MKMHTAAKQAFDLWQLIQGEQEELSSLHFTGAKNQLLPSVCDVTGFALASIGIAGLAAVKLKVKRLENISSFAVEVDTLEACAAFQSERLLQPIGWELPKLWDSIAGDYPTKDTWIRLHTNYKNHRVAALDALQLKDAERNDIEQKAAQWMACDLEAAVIAKGGCAAVMYTRDHWLKTAFGISTINEQPINIEMIGKGIAGFGKIAAHEGPLSGIRVLDLTRVIAGPECTKFLALQGADVLRIDPPGFEEVPALLPDTTVGKRCAILNLSKNEELENFKWLLKEAHVLVLGLRAGAIDQFGLTLHQIREINPSIIIAQINAYGWKSDWSARRGFDSLVQMSSGIAAWGAKEKNANRPAPLPVQALDHGAGFLLAAGICRALDLLYKHQILTTVRSSLIGAANFLFSQAKGDINSLGPDENDFASCLFEDQTEWGKVKRVLPPGLIDGERALWNIPAGSLGKALPSFV